jgi:phospholipase/lecithinase/hemolysin
MVNDLLSEPMQIPDTRGGIKPHRARGSRIVRLITSPSITFEAGFILTLAIAGSIMLCMTMFVTVLRLVACGACLSLLAQPSLAGEAAEIGASGQTITPGQTPSGGVSLQVVSFGDSLSDVGTYAPFAAPNFGGGEFTTNPGTIWTQRVAAYYGGTLTPAFQGGFGQPLKATGGFGYAQGGARVSEQPGVGHAAAGTTNADFASETTVPVTQQVDQYLAAHERFRPDQLVLVNGGANDLIVNFQAVQANPLDLPAALIAINRAAVQLGDQVARIYAAGALHVVVLNLTDFSKAPLAPTTGLPASAIQVVVESFNATLKATLFLHRLSDRVIYVDTFGFLDQTVAYRAVMGFTAPASTPACDPAKEMARATVLGMEDPQKFSDALFCSPATLVAPDAAQAHIFADMVHPADWYSALFAAFVEQRISASGLGR